MKHINLNGFRSLVKTYGRISNIPVGLLSKVSNKVLKKLSPKETKELVDTAVKYWQHRGYPFESCTDKDIEKEYKRMVEFNINSISNGKEIGQNFMGLDVVNSFHPKRHSVKCRNFYTPIDNFLDEKRLAKVMKKIIQISSTGNPFLRSNFKSIIKIFSGTHLASNFRPTAAKYVYEKYCPVGGKILDPSLGFSGRLFGALTSCTLSHYEGCDPCTETYENGLKFYNTIKRINNKGSKLSSFLDIECRKLPNVVLHNIPFEEYQPKEEFFDLVFTSPPYFNVEKYSDEETQSWKKYGTYDLWLKHFLFPSVDICYRGLKKGGYMIYNIAGKKPPMEKDFVDYATKVFGPMHDTIFLQLTKMFGIKYKGKTDMTNRVDHKLEPCFIFRK